MKRPILHNNLGACSYLAADAIAFVREWKGPRFAMSEEEFHELLTVAADPSRVSPQGPTSHAWFATRFFLAPDFFLGVLAECRKAWSGTSKSKTLQRWLVNKATMTKAFTDQSGSRITGIGRVFNKELLDDFHKLHPEANASEEDLENARREVVRKVKAGEKAIRAFRRNFRNP